MPLSLATRCGGRLSSKQARTIAALIEIVAATGAQRRNRPFIVAMGEAERVDLERGVVKLRLRQIGHAAVSSVRGAATRRVRAAISRWMKRAVIGVPS